MKVLFLTISLIFLSNCALLVDTSVEARHNSWVIGMQRNIGKNMYDCTYWICSDRKIKYKFLGDKTLPNGNLESGFSTPYRSDGLPLETQCRYYFEYEPTTGLIVRFRYEESQNFACKTTGA